MNSPLVGFTKDAIQVEEMVKLTIRMGQYPLRSIVKIDFLVIRAPSTYNAILRQLGLNAFRVVVSIYYLKIKFSMVHGVREIYEDQSLVFHCYHIVLHRAGILGAHLIDGLDTRDDLLSTLEMIC